MKKMGAIIIVFIVLLVYSPRKLTFTHPSGIPDDYVFAGAILGPVTRHRYNVYKNLKLKGNYCFENTVTGEKFWSYRELISWELKHIDNPTLLKIDQDLMEYIDKHEMVNVIIVLDYSLGASTIEQLKNKYKPIIRELNAEILAILKHHRPSKSLKHEEELKTSVSLPEKDMQRIKELNLQLDKVINLYRKDLHKALIKVYQSLKNVVESEISTYGGVVLQNITPNIILARIPGTYIKQLANMRSVIRVAASVPYYNLTTLDHSTYAINADEVWIDGYTYSVYDVGIIDTGVDQSHDSLEYRYDATTQRIWYEQSWLDINDDGIPDEDADDYNGHGTHCAGIVASSSVRDGYAHDDYRGVAYDIHTMIDSKGLSNSGSGEKDDLMNAMDWAAIYAPDDADILSCSWGFTEESDGVPENGEGLLAHFVDALIDDYFCIAVFAAGNEGPDLYTLRHPADAYNVISVGAMDDHNTNTRTDDTMPDFSSRGPTDDYRKKPDLVAPGVNIKSCNYNYEWWFDFVDASGTSMAAPHVSGAAALLAEVVGWYPLAIKAVLINTAEDLGPIGWDEAYGWGYIDLWHAYFHISDFFEDQLGANEYKFYKGVWQPGDTATLVWNRHMTYQGAGEPTDVMDLSDLDLYLYDEDDGQLIDYSISSKDNVEQVYADSSFNAVLKVTPYWYPPGINLEDYVLSTEEGFVEVTPPTFTSLIENPDSVEVGSTFTVTAYVTNNGDITAHNVLCTLNLPAGLTIVSGSNPANIGSLSPGTQGSAYWTVQAISPGTYTITVDVESSCYGETFVDSGSSSITIEGACKLKITYSNDRTGDWDVILGEYAGNKIENKTRIAKGGGDQANSSVAVESKIAVAYESNVVGNWELYLKYSDDGETWNIVRVTQTLYNERNPSIAIYNNEIYLVYMNDKSGNWDLFLRISSNWGLTWSTIRITRTLYDECNPEIIVSNGVIFLVYQSNKYGQWDLFLRKSTDGGQTWTTRRITRTVYYDECSPSIACIDNAIYIIYENNRPGQWDLFLRKSTDGGQTWTTRRITRTVAFNDRYPSIAICGGIYIVYSTNKFGQWDLFLRWTPDEITWQVKRLTTTAISNEVRPSVCTYN